jgi:23S rRNA pseudouridine2457 synthase
MDFSYFLIYKPYMTLCQFTKEQAEDSTLADLEIPFPKDCYPVGRLDKDSEGLLLLSNDNFLKTRFLNPNNKHRKTYLAQVEGQMTAEAISQLQRGVKININGKTHQTLPAQVQLVIADPELPERQPPIRYRANIPTSWIRITITEGKNRQVRKMCAAVGFPVLRLVRYSLEAITLSHLKQQNYVEMRKAEIYPLLNMNRP